MSARIIVADVLEGLASLPPNSVQCVVTSPPYWGLRDYGVPGQLGLEATPREYLIAMRRVFRAVRRVLRRDGTLWLNMGDNYVAAANSGHGWDKSGLTKPNGRERKVQTAQRASMMKHRRFPALKPKDLVGMPWRLALALQRAGWWLRSDIVWAKPNAMPESVTDRPTRSHEYVFLLAKARSYYYDADAIRTPLRPKTFTTYGCGPGESKGNDALGNVKADNWQRTVPVRAPRMKRPDGWATHEGAHGSFHRDGREQGGPPVEVELAGANARSVWTIATQAYPEAHFATFPEALVEPCILAGSRRGDLVLDPFAGSGTVGVVAARLGRDFVGVELNERYAELARRRLEDDSPLFATVDVSPPLVVPVSAGTTNGEPEAVVNGGLFDS